MRWLPVLVFLSSLGARAESYDLEHLIKVRLEKRKTELTLAGAGLKIAGRGGENPLAWDRRTIQFKSGTWIITPSGGGSRREVTGRILRIGGADLRSAFQEWPSRLLLVGRGSTFDVIGEMNLRDYLVGVVAHEMPRRWPQETLKAQAVAARSYALAVRNANLGGDFHVESTVEDQVFAPLPESREDARGVREAVRTTDGLVLTLGERKILKAYYHADCGGRTVSAAAVWPGERDSGTAVDEFCPASPKARWTMELALGEIAKRLESSILNPMSLVAFAKESRVASLTLTGANGSATFSAQDFRMRIGAGDLRSTNFEIERTKEKFIFRGKGFGHGVGLCQWGSRMMGLRGSNASQILAHYYPKARLARGED